MKRLLTFLFTCISCFIHAQVAINSLEDALALMRRQSPGYRISDLNDRISYEKVVASRSALLPQVKAFAGFDNNISLPVQLVPAQFLGGPEGEFTKVQFGTRYSANLGAEASMPLLNVSNWKNITTAKEGRILSSFEKREKDLQLTEEIIHQYYLCLLSKEAISLTRELYVASDSLLRAADARLQNGSIEMLDFNRVKALNLETLNRFRKSKTLFQTAVNTMKHLLGTPLADSLIITEKLGVMASAEPRQLKIASTDLPIYRIGEAKYLQAKENLLKQQSKILPELSLYARYTRQSFSNESTSLISNQWFDIGVVGVRAEWNLFTGLSRHATIEQARYQKVIGENEKTLNRSEAERQLRDLALNHELAFESMKNCRERYELNLANYRIASIKYNEGVYAIDQYVDVYDDMVSAQNFYLEALADFLIYDAVVQSKNTLAQ